MQFRGTWSAGPSDDQARFLADLRALRDSAAIGYDELAARAHYPSDVLKEAENGPYLPGLPILAAYVRACEGDVLDWEERWRRLNPEVGDDPNLPVRPVGASAAAVAGARAGIGIAPPDVYNPDRIRAALRGDHARTEQGSRRANGPGVSAPDGAGSPGRTLDMAGASPDSGAGRGTSTGWDTPAEPGVTSANGNHLATRDGRGPFDVAFTQAPDSAEPAQTEDFSWLKKNAPVSQSVGSDTARPEQADTAHPEPGNTWFEHSRSAEQATREVGWSAGQTEAGPVAEPADGGPAWPERPDGGPASRPEVEPARVQSEPARVQGESAPASLERTDFWSKPVPPAPTDLQPPAALRRAEEPAVARASWAAPGAGGTTPAAAAEPGQRAATDGGAATAAQPARAVGPAARASVAAPDYRRQDRYFPVRLLVVIVIAALIGSALVLLLK